MPTGTHTAAPRSMLWTGRVLSGLMIGLFLFDAATKIIPLRAVVEGSAQMGYAAHLIRPTGIVLLLCVILYAVPPTAVLGAVLLTAFLGGAVVTTLRVGNPLFWIPVLLGVVVWAGLFLREPRLRALLPLRSSNPPPPRNLH